MRVVAGALRGRRLKTAPGLITRPTSERARAGLFDSLGARVVGTAVLDLYAGSGALGIEALSRAATTATFIERDRRALRALRANLADLDLEEASDVRARDVGGGVRDLCKESRRFDLIFADPPYGMDGADGFVGATALHELVEPSGLLIVEHDRREPEPRSHGPLRPCGTRCYGGTRFDWYEMAESGRRASQ